MIDPDHPPLVRIEPLGASFDAPDSLTVLEAAAFARVSLPRSCRNGTCRSCLCRIVSGSVRYTIEWPGLSRDEKADGYTLPCVAVATSDLVLDVPDAVMLDQTRRAAARVVLPRSILHGERDGPASFRWHPFAIDPDFDYASEPMTLVTFTLAAQAGGTLLTVTETGFDQLIEARRATARDMNDWGWAAQMTLIAKYLALHA